MHFNVRRSVPGPGAYNTNNAVDVLSKFGSAGKAGNSRKGGPKFGGTGGPQLNGSGSNYGNGRFGASTAGGRQYGRVKKSRAQLEADSTPGPGAYQSAYSSFG